MLTPRRLIHRSMTIVASFALVVIVGGVAPTVAHAASRYYFEVGGTGASAPAPQCTKSYGFANQHLAGGTPVGICYPASIGPVVDGNNNMPAPGAPGYDASVGEGVKNLLDSVKETHRRDPSAHLTIVGYSQGADVADRVLETIAKGGTGIPKSQVNGQLYSDPRQPGTGIWNLIPKGLSISVPGPGGAMWKVTSPGAGPAKFDGIQVQRHCIRTDGICDATSLASIGGYFQQHPLYPQDGGIMTKTITQQAEGIVWH